MKNSISIKFKWGDVIIIAAVLCIAAAVFFVFLPKNSDKPLFAEIRQNGTTLASLPLDKDTEYSVNGSYTNLIKIENGKVFFLFSDCPNNDCVNMGKLEKHGDIAVCLPNGVSVEIVGGDSEIDAVAG